MAKDIKSLIHELAAYADIEIGGDRPWDMIIHNDNFYERILAHGSLGLGESYMDEWWDCSRVDECIARILSAQIDRRIKPSLPLIWEAFRARIFNLQN